MIFTGLERTEVGVADGWTLNSTGFRPINDQTFSGKD